MTALVNLIVAGILITLINVSKSERTYLYQDCGILGTHFCIGTKDNVTSFVGEGCMRDKDCQVVLRMYRVPSSRRIYWTACGVTDPGVLNRRHWIQFMASNTMVAIVPDTKGHLTFPKEHVYVACIPLNITSVRIWHAEELPQINAYETLKGPQRTASYERRSAWINAIEGETDKIVDCHRVETGYFSTYTDTYSKRITFSVDYNSPIQISLIDWFYQVDSYGNKVRGEEYHVQNVIQNMRPIKVWEEVVGNPDPIPTRSSSSTTTTSTTTPRRPVVGPVSPTSTTPEDATETEEGTRQPQNKSATKNGWVVPVVILVLFLVLFCALVGCFFCVRQRNKRDRRAKEAARRLRLINAIEKVNKNEDKNDGKKDFETISATSKGSPPTKGKGPNPFSVVSKYWNYTNVN